MPLSSESTGLQPNKEGNQSAAPGFQPSGGIASTTRVLTPAKRSDSSKEKRKAYRRKHYAGNKEKIKVQTRKWKAANREHVLEKKRENSRKYYAANKEKIQEWQRKYREQRKARAANRENYVQRVFQDVSAESEGE